MYPLELCVIILFSRLCSWVQGDDPSSNAYYSHNTPVADAFIRSKIVPDVLDVPPQQQLTISFNGTKFLAPGNEMKPGEVQVQPELSWTVSSPDQLYTVAELDLDSPAVTNTSWRSVCHWLVYNIPQNSVSRGDIFAVYTGSLPTLNSGLHRYAFVVFPQTRRLTLTPLASTNLARLNFDMRGFMRQNGLDQPVAGNYYLAQADEYSVQFWATHTL